MSPKHIQINLANGILFFEVTINISSTTIDYLLQNLGDCIWLNTLPLLFLGA